MKSAFINKLSLWMLLFVVYSTNEVILVMKCSVGNCNCTCSRLVEENAEKLQI